MSLFQDGKEITNLTNLELKQGDSSFVSSTYHSKGNWYFEFSHHGGDGTFSIGFNIQNQKGSVASNPAGNYPSMYGYATDNVKLNGQSPNSETNTIYDIGLQYSYGDRFGIGIDLTNHNVYYIHNSILRSCTFESDQMSWQIAVRETTNTGNTDTVSIFLLKKDFMYEPPFGALPWYSHIKLTCNKKSLIFKHIFLYEIIFTL